MPETRRNRTAVATATLSLTPVTAPSSGTASSSGTETAMTRAATRNAATRDSVTAGVVTAGVVSTGVVTGGASAGRTVAERLLEWGPGHDWPAHPGADRDNADRMTPVHLLARQLAEEIRILVSDARAGRAEVSLAIHPALLASYALEALTGSEITEKATDLRALRLRQVAQSLRGAADLLDELAAFD